MSGSLPPLEAISPDNNGPAVVAAAFTLIVVTILFAAIRLVSLVHLKRPFGVDDAFLIFAVIIGIVQTITVQKSVDSGLGKFENKLSASALINYYKYAYTSDILSIAAMACAKFSVLHLMYRLSTQGMQRVYPMACASLAIWTVFSFFAIVFQCGTTNPWIYTSSRCAGQGALWYPIIIINIITDGILAFLFAPIAWKLQMSFAQRATVMSLFSARILVCIAGIAQIVVLAPALKSRDQTRRHTVPAILEQVVMNLSILTATIPSLHRFLTELQTSRLGTVIPTTQYELSQGSGKGSGKGNGWKQSFKGFSKGGVSANKSHNSEKLGTSSSNGEGRTRIMDFRPDLLDKNQASIQHEPANLTETGSRTSDGSQDMIIRQTVAWEVQHYEERDNPEVPGNSRAHSQHHAM